VGLSAGLLSVINVGSLNISLQIQTDNVGITNANCGNSGDNMTKRQIRAQKLFDACNYKGTFANCRPECCIACCKESDEKTNQSPKIQRPG